MLLFQRQEPPLTKGAERERFYDRRSHPARLTMEETAWALGFSAHEIPVLIAKGLLQPLGHPAPNTMKWFAAETVEGLRHDVNQFYRRFVKRQSHPHWEQAAVISPAAPRKTVLASLPPARSFNAPNPESIKLNAPTNL